MDRDNSLAEDEFLEFVDLISVIDLNEELDSLSEATTSSTELSCITE